MFSTLSVLEFVEVDGQGVMHELAALIENTTWYCKYGTNALRFFLNPLPTF